MKPNLFIPTALAVLASFFAAPSAKAETFTWAPTSNGGQKNWNTAGIWGTGVTVPLNSAANDLVFAGNFKLDNIMQADYTVGGISFATGASAFTLSGDGTLTLMGGGFANNSVLNQTVAIANMILGADQAWNAGSGDLTFSGTSLNLNGSALSFSGNNNFAIANAISGSGSINKTGAGNLSLTGDNSSYTGTTTVSAGTLAVNNLTGSATGSGAVTIASGAHLTGGGTITGPVTMQGGGTLSAGNAGTGQITVGDLTLASGSTIVVQVRDINGTAGVGWDRIVADSFTLSGGTPVVIDVSSLALDGSQGSLAGFDSALGYSWEIVSTSGGIFNFSPSAFDIQLGNFANDTGLGDFNILEQGNSLFLTFTPVPEPSTIAMGVLGSVMVFGSMLRRRKKK
ncbi:MAG: autotransporter-associated beta strand repeat-containing protein [Verrucomicrobia bacterium]|nr:autotransporter-associated beta strand repeat-containing protein [Verrucomicrobiota bacterium]